MSRHFRRLSVAEGSSLCTVGVLVGLALLIVVPHIRSIPVDVLFLLAAWFCLWFFSHDLAHHVVGRIVGVGFRYYFLGRSSITKLSLPIVSNLLRMFPVLGLKIDKSSLKSASPNKARAMYASGVISSMFLPWIVIPTGFSVGLTIGILFTILSILYVVFTLYICLRVCDLHHFRKV